MTEQVLLLVAYLGLTYFLTMLGVECYREAKKGIHEMKVAFYKWRVKPELSATQRAKDREQLLWRRGW
jgi:hypothetical protein